MQFLNSLLGHVLFDPLIATFKGQTLFWPSMLPKSLISKKIKHAQNANLKIAFLYVVQNMGSDFFIHAQSTYILFGKWFFSKARYTRMNKKFVSKVTKAQNMEKNDAF